ncbi:hypothetical protein HNR00_001213 [Methylorubrum rhodinum]|uniref:Lipoprotein n=1 Tax=Methylorubrum rhodinum TaxID=29428 RepID=A0A840ZH87_9HYPH|nr:hypothetical protein [Methylorubrum rhodinum]MBB5756515.1 hypothetical protein [Methylorubrum rhodinum]
MRSKYSILAILVALLVAGCAADRNNLHALYIASTFDSLLTKQVAYNLLETYHNRYKVPSYVKIGTQTARTSEAINPTFAIPILPQKTITQGSSFSRGIQNANTGISLQLQALTEATYTITTIDDPDGLRRLRLLFQYAVGHIDEFEFEANYPIFVSGDSATYEELDPKKRSYVRRVCEKLSDDGGYCEKYGFLPIKPDLTFIRTPGCIMCDYNTPLRDLRPNAPRNAYVLQKNFKIFGRSCKEDKSAPVCDNTNAALLFYPPNEIGADAVPVTTVTGDVLHLKGERGIEGFNELTLFAQEASSQGAAGIGDGGQSFGRKSPPLLRVSSPTSGGGLLQ